MKSSKALMAGLAGALAMSAAMAALRSAGFNTDLEAMLGSLVIAHSGPMQWGVGFAIHLAMGSFIAWFYAAGFEFAVQRSGMLVGGGLGLSHGLLAGLFMSGIEAMNPYGGGVHASGAFFQNVAPSVLVGPLLFVLLHVLYGALVGAIYGRPLQTPHAFTMSSHPQAAARFRESDAA